MASQQSISRLHQETAPEPERERFKLRNLRNLEIDVSAPSLLELAERSCSLRPVRGRSGFRRAEPEAYQLDCSTILSMVDAGAPPDRSGAFEVLAERERLMRMARRFGARGSQDFPPV